MRRARLFARVYKSATNQEALLKLPTPEGLPLGWSHVQGLISVKDTKPSGRGCSGWRPRRTGRSASLVKFQACAIAGWSSYRRTRARFRRSRAIEKPRETLNAIWKG